MKQPLGITFVVPGDCDATGVYASDDGVEAFETDVPYLLSDGKSLVRPLPVVLVDGPVFIDKLGHAQTALAVNIGGGPGPGPGPEPGPEPDKGGVVHNGIFVTHEGAQVVYTG